MLNDLSLENQELLLENTVNHNLIITYPLKISYQKTFLKIVLDQLVKQNAVVEDGIYEAYGRLVALNDLNCYYKHFELNKREIVTLIEKSAFISEGTTGLSTWEVSCCYFSLLLGKLKKSFFLHIQASLVLAEWCIQNKTIFHNKSVLELGAGVGLTGITVNLKCQPSRVFLTDCHDTVLATLEKNARLNFNNYDETANITVLNLPWEVINPERCNNLLGKIDVIIASDVVYDSQLFHPLADAIKCLLVYCGTQEAYLACTVRNSSTLDGFLDVLSRF